MIVIFYALFLDKYNFSSFLQLLQEVPKCKYTDHSSLLLLLLVLLLPFCFVFSILSYDCVGQIKELQRMRFEIVSKINKE